MKAAVLYGLLCTICIGLKSCCGEFTDIKDNSNSGKCENEKERLRVADQEIKIANLVNTIMAQNVKIANLESTIMAQNTEFEKLSKNVLERRINQMTTDYRFYERLQQEVEHRKHLNESQNALVEKVKALEINYSTNISELKGTLRVIQEKVSMSFEHRKHWNESQNSLVEKMKALEINYSTNISELKGTQTAIQEQVDYIKASETNHSIDFDELKSTQSVFLEQMEKCFKKQSLLASNLQKIVNETAELAVVNEDIRRELRLLKGTDCQDLQSEDNFTSGVYNIRLKGQCCISVYCDMDTDGGGWTVFQHRYDGSVNFFRSWADYKTGFGNLQTEFWLGNDNIHRITEQGKYKLRIQLEDFSGNKRYAEYSSFNVADENNKYRLRIGSHSGTAENSLSLHNNMMFSTIDRDNDRYKDSCSHLFRGGWWYKDCYDSNLNGLYQNSKTSGWKYNLWEGWPGGDTNMKTTTMMMRKI